MRLLSGGPEATRAGPVPSGRGAGPVERRAQARGGLRARIPSASTILEQRASDRRQPVSLLVALDAFHD